MGKSKHPHALAYVVCVVFCTDSLLMAQFSPGSTRWFTFRRENFARPNVFSIDCCVNVELATRCIPNSNLYDTLSGCQARKPGSLEQEFN